MVVSRRRAEIGALALAGACALAIPALARRHVERRIADDIEPALADACGVPVGIGSVDASLLGTFRLGQIAVGDMVRARAVEASISWPDLASGRVRAREIRIDRPSVAVEVDARGDADLARVARRALARLRRGSETETATGTGTGLRRVVVVGGDLIVDVGSVGRARLGGLELSPTATGVRATAQFARAEWTLAGVSGTARFSRVAADVDSADLALRRLLAAGGAIELGDGADRLRIRDAVVSRGITGDRRLRAAGTIVHAGPDSRVQVALGRAGDGITLDLAGDRLPLAALGPAFPRWIDLSRATASGRARVSTSGELDVDVDADTDGVVLDHRSIADQPVAIGGRVTGRVSVRQVAGRRFVDVRQLALRTGSLELRLRGRAEVAAGEPIPHRADLVFEVPRTPCAGAIASLPAGFRDRLAGFDADGTLAARVALAFDRFDPESASLAVDLDVRDCRVRHEPDRADPRRLLASFRHVFPNGGRAQVGPGEPGYVELRALPRHVSAAWISAEDAQFYDHNGFDPHQIERSLAINLAEGRLLRGGSTMTQQLVKNVFLDPRRTLARKLQEAVLTWRTEAHLSKRQILERYFNIIELGEGIHGLNAAARYWFDKPARELGVAEAAFLAALTPAPRTLSERIRAHGGLDDVMAERVDLVLRAMRQNRLIDRPTFERARRAKLRLAPVVASR